MYINLFHIPKPFLLDFARCRKTLCTQTFMYLLRPLYNLWFLGRGGLSAATDSCLAKTHHYICAHRVKRHILIILAIIITSVIIENATTTSIRSNIFFFILI